MSRHDRAARGAAARAAEDGGSAGPRPVAAAPPDPLPDSQTDAQLVRQAQRGNTRAFEALVRRYLRAAYAVALAGVGEPADAEDVCQDAYLRCLRHIGDCREPERFRAWLLAIVRNRAHNFRQYRKLREAEAEPAAGAAAAADSPLRDAARAELRGHLRAALEKLTELQRRVIVLHDLEGWQHKEIAGELGISAGASRFHLHVARRALRARLAPLYPRGSA
ncbi:MAG: sigma-70 family RNA polymerase sigma factor [Gemmatimonadetes bacterium]|nr:sigma-70 family RNA polymerase sigma factor [Gemmatimonadota bacterium]